MSGAVPKYLPMRREATSSQKGGIASSSEWKIDPKELEKVLTDRSKLLILNTPHNPTGKVELLGICDQSDHSLASELKF